MPPAGDVAKSVDASDLKSEEVYASWGFESPRPYQLPDIWSAGVRGCPGADEVATQC